MTIKIYPGCKAEEDRYKQSLAVTFEGYLVPCCNIMGAGIIEMRDRLGEKFEQLHVSNGTFEEILKSEAYTLIEEIIESQMPFETCKQMCAIRRSKNTPSSRSSSMVV